MVEGDSTVCVARSDTLPPMFTAAGRGFRVDVPVLILSAVVVCGCGGQRTEPDPIAALNSPSLTGTQHRKAIEALDATPSDDPATIKALTEVVSRDGYSAEIREEALKVLE